MIIGKRRFLLTLYALTIFGIVLVVNGNIDPFVLGLGLGLLLTPHVVSKFAEVKSPISKENNLN